MADVTSRAEAPTGSEERAEGTTHADPTPESKAEPEPKVEAEAETPKAPKTKIKKKDKTTIVAEPDTAVGSGPELESVPKPEAEAESVAKPEAEAESEAESVAKPEAESEAESVAKPEAESEAESVAKPEAESVAEPETVPEPGPECATEAATTEPAARPRSRRTLVTAGLAALVVVFWVAGGVLFMHNRNVGAADAQRPIVLNAAQKVATDLTSVGADNAKQQIDSLTRESTGAFRQQISTYAAALQAVLTQSQAGSIGKVSSAGIERMDDRSAIALLTVDAALSNQQADGAQPMTYRMTIRMQRVDDKWLASDVTVE